MDAETQTEQQIEQQIEEQQTDQPIHEELHPTETDILIKRYEKNLVNCQVTSCFVISILCVALIAFGGLFGLLANRFENLENFRTNYAPFYYSLLTILVLFGVLIVGTFTSCFICGCVYKRKMKYIRINGNHELLSASQGNVEMETFPV